MTQTPVRLVYTVRDAIAAGVFTSKNKLYAAISRGELRSYTAGKRRLISLVALNEYILRRERETADAPRAENVRARRSGEAA